MPCLHTSQYHNQSVTAPKLKGGTTAQIGITQSDGSVVYTTLSGDATLAADGTVTVSAGTIQPGDVGTIGKAGTNIAKDDAVYVSSVTADGTPVFSIADADVAGAQAVYIANAALASGATSTTPIFRKACLSAATLNTNAGNVGDKVYLTTTGTTGNTWSLTPPSGANAIVQAIGKINVKSATIGQIAWDLTGQPQETIGSNELQALSVGTAAIAAGAVTEAKIATASLTGLVSANVAAPIIAAPGAAALVAANVGTPIIMVLDIGDGAGNFDFTGVPYKMDIVSVDRIQLGAGDAGNSATLDNGTGGTHITNAMNNATDGGVASGTPLTNRIVTAGATLRVVSVKAGGTSACRIVITAIRIA